MLRYPWNVSDAARIFEVPSLSVAGIQHLLLRLPAEQRASLAWAPVRLGSAMGTFLDGTLDETSFRELAASLATSMEAIEAVVLSLVFEEPELIDSEESWALDLSELRAHVSEATADMAEWAAKAWMSCLRRSVRDMRTVGVDEVRKVLARKDERRFSALGSPMRVQAMLMAAIEASKRKKPEPIVIELIERAFDEATTLLQLLRASGIEVDPFDDETPAARSERALRYVDHLRHELTDEDMRVLEASRLEQLR